MKRFVILILSLLVLCAAVAPLPAATPGVGPVVEEHVPGPAEHSKETFFGIPAGFLKFINLVLFLAFLVWILGRPLRKVFGDRKDQIRAQLAEATVRQTKADQLAADIEARLRHIEGEVEQIIARAHEDGERQKSEMIAAAEAEAQKILTQARNEIDARVKAARKDLTEQARHLAIERAQALVASSVTDSDRHRLFDESVSQISEVRK